ncbi:hypothetical protein QJS10_CPB12g01631 [Acorus calamus]|uniref:Uncharacterized protein n=1 Tax=Acorus calamus TaxID=4465 RepID=A0AAV9DNR3_ACOCL|nr:hypothetical protein QJS10_CPB12g01631 [Acorus calamus]
MANQGAKKRKEENKQHMVKLLRLIIAANVIYVLLRILVFNSSVTWKHWVGLLLTSMAYAIPYQQLSKMASPAYSDDGELIAPVEFAEYAALAPIFSEKQRQFIIVNSLIPAFGVYKLSGILKGFLPQGSEGEVEDEKSRKKREKMERKASRPKFMKTRNR